MIRLQRPSWETHTTPKRIFLIRQAVRQLPPNRLPLTDCLLPLGNPTGQHAQVDAQPTSPERASASGVSMSEGRSQTGQPTSVTPSGAPLGLIRDTPTAGHSLPQQPPQSAATLRSAPSTRNGPITRLNDNLSVSKHSTVAGPSAHTGTLHAPLPYSTPNPLGRSRSHVSAQPSSRQPMTTTSQNRARSGNPRPAASTQQSGEDICCCCCLIVNCCSPNRQ